MWAVVGLAADLQIVSLPSKTCLACVHSSLEYVPSSIKLVSFVVAGAYHLHNLHGPIWVCMACLYNPYLPVHNTCMGCMHGSMTLLCLVCTGVYCLRTYILTRI